MIPRGQGALSDDRREPIQLSGAANREDLTLDRRALYDILAVLAASLVVVACLVWAEWYGVFDWIMFLVGVVVPLVLGSVIVSVRRIGSSCSRSLRTSGLCSTMRPSSSTLS